MLVKFVMLFITNNRLLIVNNLLSLFKMLFGLHEEHKNLKLFQNALKRKVFNFFLNKYF